MEPPAAIRATFSDFKTVKTRSVAQLVFEIPIEQADTALKALGGVPQPQAEKWVGIARLNEKAVQSDPEPPKPRFGDLPRSRQMQKMCGVLEFQQFMVFKAPEAIAPTTNLLDAHDAAARRCKTYLGIESSHDLDIPANYSRAGKAWDTLLAEYQQSQGRMAEKR